MISFREIIVPILGTHYRLMPAPPSGEDTYVEFLLDEWLARGVPARAQYAADTCTSEPVHQKTPLQQKLYAGIVDFYNHTTDDHPAKERKAKAYAETMVGSLTSWIEQAALEKARRYGSMSEQEQVEEREFEREDEIARNRPRPPKKPLYPI